MTLSTGIGPLVLAGSGEYTPAMDAVDLFLLDRHASQPVLLIATACAPEGDDVMTKWEEMGREHFARFGVEATPVRIRDQAEADIPEHAALIENAGIVWFSGGRASYLAQAFDGTASWRALERANRNGTSVAGSSGGLGVLNVNVVDPNAEGPQPPTGLGLAAPLRAFPHFDRMETRRPEMIERAVANMLPGQVIVGVDEDTAIVWVDGYWQVMGHKRAVVYRSGQERVIFHPGDAIDILPPPERAHTPAK
jgi:cyanophycinase